MPSSTLRPPTLRLPTLLLALLALLGLLTPAVAQDLASRAGPSWARAASNESGLWMTSGRTNLGVGLGSVDTLLPSGLRPRSVAGAMPVLTLGMRYHLSDQHALFADAAGARGLGAGPAAVYVNTQLGVEWKPARSKLGFERGALGLQLESGYRLGLKARHGGPMLFVRNNF